MINKILIGIFTLASIFVLTACADNNNETNQDEGAEMDMDSGTTGENETETDPHANMEHSGSGEVPENLQVTENPTYEVGSNAIIESDHMSGMKGAEATIVGAYNTTVYSISYTPSNGGERVENHKWVIHEEIQDAGQEPLEPGTEVTIEATHMQGMESSTAVIDSAVETTVYMVDFMPTTGGEMVTNHKWVTESELSPVE
ncbi:MULTISPECIES: YdhK family protein [Bacillaceae]|jgi:hypothetical protein|uniref:DUF1541 domain-containing protein n=1 Tax=Oceanobacillus bengalensis TaxID=1435466 RepID=A0A494YRN3_9BACI|nr:MULTISPECIES: YdhK family protein [Bacillaceae]RKQ12106.1 DUF1541 domain-containing protein [Oceanobacillus bengalensis]